MSIRLLDLSDDRLTYRLRLDGGIALAEFGRRGAVPWTGEGGGPGPDFAVYAGKERIDGRSDRLQVVETRELPAAAGAKHTAVVLFEPASGLEIESHLVRYEGTALLEKWIVVRNRGGRTVRLERVDSLALTFVPGEWQLLSFSSDWGNEFEPAAEPVGERVILETRYGRSSKGKHPWATLVREDGELLNVSPMWSGNWIIRLEKGDKGELSLSAGLSDWSFGKELDSGDSFESVHVAVALGSGADLNSVSVDYARVGRNHWYPRNGLSRVLPAEWNHWWSYEDQDINERAFLANAESAADLGVEVCTLDAGWFGPSDGETQWYDYRGDWDLVNASRFPGGIRALSDAVHAKGMKFGLWCEIEAVGQRAKLAEEHPDFVARRDGASLGYLCFGNPQVREWAYHTLAQLIRDYRCDWIKLDFNLDPGAGCGCDDHGHGPGDGLYEHYRGYYAVLDRVRADFPEVLLENCASGGLRIDLGMARHTHTTFLSDPDWPEHSLQVFWGASTFLAPDACLHWSYSEWRGEHPNQRFRASDPSLTPERFDCYTRISMLHGFGISQKLPELPSWIAERLRLHIADYRQLVRRFVREADLYRLTGQPLHDGRGDRWSAFQYSLPAEDEHLLFVFRLAGAEPSRTLKLRELAADARYELTWSQEERAETHAGIELLFRGLPFAKMEEESSALIRIRRL
ncbi:alpha-galactosidase [Cohnella zeiphila]|uniref:Alpha-galactosidase n=1 Tax=Cohnella zeiphila TaxID=2761120 RepID=A0A7X0SQ28_9BACL|nr:alpha-galactosidase [Cohnella zeiphila]MBB6731793.1 alpha-galactosidase [Cohnella zeiphila]